ncbi:MAG: NfeD family protein, partial [Actinomycetota bacterium]
MRRTAARLLLGVLLALTALAAGAHAALAQTAPSQTVVQLELSGVVDGFVADYLTGSIARAQDAGDQAVLIQIDTPGGLDSSMRQITQGILAANIPVICYVAPGGARAASAGAFILESCPVAAMAPGTNVGA